MRLLFHTPNRAGRRPAIFLDRDGVINERILNGYAEEWHDFRFINGAEGVLRDLTRLRVPIIVISNQSGVNRGVVRRSALREITCRFVAALERRGARIDAVYYCPHRPEEGCPCRKPRPGLLLQAARDWRIDLGASVMIGDAVTDMMAAQAAGCRGILIDATATSAGFERAATREMDSRLRGNDNSGIVTPHVKNSVSRASPPVTAVRSLAEVPPLVTQLLNSYDPRRAPLVGAEYPRSVL